MKSEENWVKQHKTDIFGDPTGEFYLINKKKFLGSYEDEDGRSGKIEAEIVVNDSIINFVIYANGSKKIMRSADSYTVAMKDVAGKRHDFCAETDIKNKVISVEQGAYGTVVAALSNGEGEVAFYLQGPEDAIHFLFKATTADFGVVFRNVLLTPRDYGAWKHAFNEGLFEVAKQLAKLIENSDDRQILTDETNLGIAATNGDANAAYQLAKDYRDGIELLKNVNYKISQNGYMDSTYWLTRSYELGNVMGALYIGNSCEDYGTVYESVREGIEDQKEADEWYRKAYELGGKDVLYMLCYKFYYESYCFSDEDCWVETDFRKKLFQDFAESVKKDYWTETEVLEIEKKRENKYRLDNEDWIELSANRILNGNAELTRKIAVCLDELLDDYKRYTSIIWYDSAAVHGDTDAAKRIGEMYENGTIDYLREESCEEEPILSAAALEKAAELNRNSDSEYDLSALLANYFYKGLDPKQIIDGKTKKDPARALYYYQRARKLYDDDYLSYIQCLFECIEKKVGNVNADELYRIGTYYFEGEDPEYELDDTEKNIPKAIELFERATDLADYETTKKIYEEFGSKFAELCDDYDEDTAKQYRAYAYRVAKMLESASKDLEDYDEDIAGNVFYWAAYEKNDEGDAGEPEISYIDILETAADDWENPMAALWLADIALEEGNYEEAVDRYDEYLSYENNKDAEEIYDFADKVYDEIQWIEDEELDKDMLLYSISEWYNIAFSIWESVTEETLSYKDKIRAARVLGIGFDDVEPRIALELKMKGLANRYNKTAERFNRDYHDEYDPEFGDRSYVTYTWYKKAAELGNEKAAERIKRL